MERRGSAASDRCRHRPTSANVSGDRSGKARAALGALVNAGADVRTISVYAIHHDKVSVPAAPPDA